VGYAVNSILYQRGIYPPESFERKQKYGLGRDRQVLLARHRHAF
jgi:hypothetical protein